MFELGYGWFFDSFGILKVLDKKISKYPFLFELESNNLIERFSTEKLVSLEYSRLMASQSSSVAVLKSIPSAGA